MTVVMQKNDCLLSLTTGVTMVWNGRKDNWFLIICLKKETKINVDKYSVWHMQWLYVVQKTKTVEFQGQVPLQNIKQTDLSPCDSNKISNNCGWENSS